MRHLDSLLVRRINKHLNEVEDPGIIKLNSLVEHLRVEYKEYGRRQKCAFRNLVNRTWECMKEEQNEIINVDECQMSYMEAVQKNTFINAKPKSIKQSPVIDLCQDEERTDKIEYIPTPQTLKKKRKLSSISNGSSKRNKTIRSYLPSVPTTSLEDFGGYRDVFNSMHDFISVPNIETVSKETLSREQAPRCVCILLCGPEGCGKTSFVQTFAAESELNLISVDGSTHIPDEASIQELFYSARRSEPCILFLDKLEELCPPINGSTILERRIFAQLCSSIDDIVKDVDRKDVIIIGATSFPDSINHDLRKSGRFENLIFMKLPDKNTRYEILKIVTRNMNLEPAILNEVALATPGYKAKDLRNLTSHALAVALSRTNADSLSKKENGVSLSCENGLLNEKVIPSLRLEISDFKKALKADKQTSIKAGGLATQSKVTWDNLGALKDVHQTLELICINPVNHPQDYAKFGIDKPTGILLYGPPGCGKTSIAKAIANEENINFISVKGPEILSKYLGESERALRKFFDRARCNQPCIIFFDEIDALFPKRSSSREGNSVSDRLVCQMLTEMDGMNDRKGVYIIGATNRPNRLDEALLRPGRFDNLIYIGLPSPEKRVEILKALTKVKPPMKDVDLDILGRDSSLDGFTGADLKGLVDEACKITGRNYREHGHELVVTMEIFREAAQKLTPSVTPKDKAMYEKIRDEYIKKV